MATVLVSDMHAIVQLNVEGNWRGVRHEREQGQHHCGFSARNCGGRSEGDGGLLWVIY